jgi:hypothetical protein
MSEIPEQSTDQSTRPAEIDYDFDYRGRHFVLRVRSGAYVGLFFNGVPRKERVYAGREPLYLWTNVELEWEEHHYIEARYWPSTGVLQATVNGEALAQWQVEATTAAVGPVAR